MGVLGDGGMAEYVTVPAANLVELPTGLDIRIASLVEPLAVAVHGHAMMPAWLLSKRLCWASQRRLRNSQSTCWKITIVKLGSCVYARSILCVKGSKKRSAQVAYIS